MSNASGYDAPLPEASQKDAWLILGPSTAGWILEIFLSGACVQQSFRFFAARSTLSKQMKRVLATALFLNGVVCATTIWEVLMWTSGQQRDVGSLWGYKIPDTYVPIPAGLTAFVVQGFFAERAWKILDRSVLFLFFISTCMIAALAGSFGLGIIQILIKSAYSDYYDLLIVTELWTWAAAITDLTISITIVSALYRKKTGYDMPTDGLVTKVIHAAMESASITTVFAVGAAVACAATWDSNTIAPDLVFLYPLPSVYTFSLLFCLHTTDHVRKEQRSRSTQSNSQSTGQPNYSNIINSPAFGPITTNNDTLVNMGSISVASPLSPGSTLSPFHKSLSSNGRLDSDVMLTVKKDGGGGRGRGSGAEAEEYMLGSGSVSGLDSVLGVNMSGSTVRGGNFMRGKGSDGSAANLSTAGLPWTRTRTRELDDRDDESGVYDLGRILSEGR